MSPNVTGDPPVSALERLRVPMLYLLLAAFMFVALAPLCSVAWLLIDHNREALTTSQQEYQLLLASRISREMDIHVETLEAQLVRGSRAVALATARGEGRGDAATRAALDAAVDDRMRYVRFTDLHGRSIDTLKLDGRHGDLEAEFHGGFQKTVEGLAVGREADTEAVTYSDPVILAGTPRRSVLVLSAPVVAGGRLLGVVSSIVDIQAVWDAVVAGHRTGHALFAVDAKGQLFASTDLPNVEIGRDMSDSAIVKRFRDHPGMATETMPFDWSPRRAGAIEHYLGSYEVSREGWGVFVQARESSVYWSVLKMRDTTWKWGLLAFAAALLAAFVFARVLAEPIRRLDVTTEAFARGDYSARVNVRSITEVGTLADKFNAMAAKLEEKIRRLNEEVKKNKDLFRGTARALTSAIDAKDPYTKGHSVRVERYSTIIARYCRLPDSKVQEVEVAALLHDVGKIGVDDAILRKTDRLTPEEFEAMKLHTVKGEKIMAPIDQAKPYLAGLRSHHERWAGGGYPDDLKGDQIPLMARIIAVADSFDAMTTDRPYQRAMSFDQALEKLNRLKGSAFDEHVIEAFNRAFRAGEFAASARSTQPRPAPEPTVA